MDKKRKIGLRETAAAWLAAAACWAAGAAAARGEAVSVAACERDPAADFWAAADVRFCQNVMDEVFALAGVEPRPAGFGADGMMSTADAEVVCSAFRTPRLLRDYDFPVQPLGRMHYGLYTTPDRAESMLAMRITDWPRMKVAYSPVSQGQLENSDREDYFRQADLSPEYVEYPESTGAVEGLKKGEVDVLFLYTPYGKRPEGLVEIVPLGSRNVYFAVRQDRPELLERLTAAYREWYIDHIDRSDAWREELLGIPKPEKRVRIAAFSRGDLFRVSPDGTRSGVVAEWFRSLCEMTRWTPDYVYGDYDQSLRDVRTGRLDMVGGIGYTPENAADFLFPHVPIGVLRLYLWTHRGTPYLAGRPDTWAGMKLGVLTGTPTAGMVREQMEADPHGVEVKEYASERELAADYESGAVDACVSIEMPVLAKDRALRFYGAHQMYLACATNRPELFAELERVMDQAGDHFPTYLRMLRKRHHGVHNELSELTTAEAEWLARRKRDPAPVTVDFSPWPFPVADAEGNPEGFPKALLEELSQRTGLHFAPAPQTKIQTATAKFLRGDTALWAPYPAVAEEEKYGAVKVVSVPVPPHCAATFGAADVRQDFVLLARPETPEELVGILRKAFAGMSTDRLQEMFSDAVAGRKAQKRLFGLGEEELKRYGALAGLGFFGLVTVYGAVMMVLLKRHARRAEEAALRAEESAQAKTRFLAMMSHELRTPLNAVIGFAEFLERDGLDAPRREEFVQGIITSATTLLDLINDILDLSKLEAGAMRMRTGGCSVAAAMAELPAIFGYRTEENNVSLRVERVGDADVPDVVLSKQGFRQILLNLVGNASKFTKDGVISVEYGWTPEGAGKGTLRLEVRDTGCGISPEKMDRLFDPFVQDIGMRMQGAESKTKGTGLGLPIVKRLVDAAGGRIAVKSEIGKGTAISVTFPSLCVAARAPEKPSGDGGAAKVPGSALVVDDISINRKVLGIHLKNLGVGDVRFAENGFRALEAMRGWTPEVVLTDMWMPGMDGRKLSEAMAADGRLSKIPLVAVTADVEMENGLGARHFSKTLAKPVTNAKLRALFGELDAGGHENPR